MRAHKESGENALEYVLAATAPSLAAGCAAATPPAELEQDPW